jgi:hypothetical protein
LERSNRIKIISHPYFFIELTGLRPVGVNLNQGDTMKAKPFDVYFNSRLIDTVFYDGDMSADDVKKSLIDHDGYRSCGTMAGTTG